MSFVASGILSNFSNKRVRQLELVADQIIPIVIGETRVSGYLFAYNYRTGTHTLGIVWSIGPQASVGSIKINDANPVSGVSVNNYTGSEGQLADPLLVAAIKDYTDTLPHFAYSAIQFTNSHYSKPPVITAQLGGYIDTTLPTGILAQILTTGNFGITDYIDSDSLAKVREYNNEIIGGNQRNSISIALEKAASLEKWIEMLSAYGSFWIHREGATWYVRSHDHIGDVVMEITEDNLTESPKIQRFKQNEMPNQVIVEYLDDDAIPQRVEVRTCPAQVGSCEARNSLIRMHGIRNHGQAYREAYKRLSFAQKVWQISLNGNITLLPLLEGDRVILRTEDVVADCIVWEQPTYTSDGKVRLSLVRYSSEDFDTSSPSIDPNGYVKDHAGVPARVPLENIKINLFSYGSWGAETDQTAQTVNLNTRSNDTFTYFGPSSTNKPPVVDGVCYTYSDGSQIAAAGHGDNNAYYRSSKTGTWSTTVPTNLIASDTETGSDDDAKIVRWSKTLNMPTPVSSGQGSVSWGILYEPSSGNQRVGQCYYNCHSWTRTKTALTGSSRTLTWNAPDDNNSTILGYDVRIGNNQYTTTATRSLTNPFANLRNGEHKVEIRAINAYGYGLPNFHYSLEITNSTLNPKPLAPTSITGTVSGGTISLGWTIPTQPTPLTHLTLRYKLEDSTLWNWLDLSTTTTSYSLPVTQNQATLEIELVVLNVNDSAMSGIKRFQLT